MENEKRYRLPPIPQKYFLVNEALHKYGFGLKSEIVEYALAGHAISTLEHILEDAENYNAQGESEYLDELLAWLRSREKVLTARIYHITEGDSP